MMVELKNWKMDEKGGAGQRIRGPNLAVLIKRANGVPFEEGLARANAENRAIASNKRLSQVLESKEREYIIDIEVFPCWSGIMAAYVKPDEKLGKAVEYVDSVPGYRWVFPVPKEHQDKKDSILVAAHPNYNLEIDGNNRIVHAAQVDLIERFPAKYGRYLGDTLHDIPCGRDSIGISDQDARYLWRIDSRVGPCARGIYWNGSSISGYVILAFRPSDRFGVAVEAP